MANCRIALPLVKEYKITFLNEARKYYTDIAELLNNKNIYQYGGKYKEF